MKHCVRVLLIAALYVSITSLPTQAQPSTGTLIFRPYLCPTGYADSFYPEVCSMATSEARAHRIGQEAGAVTASVEVDGAVFVLQPGTYELLSGIPGDFSFHRAIRCWSSESEIAGPISLEAGERVECEQIIFPVSNRARNPADEMDASLTIRARYCDPEIDPSTFHTNCFDQPAANLEFKVRNQEYSAVATTDQTGNLTVNLPDFSYSLNLSGPLGETPVWRFCSAAEHPGVPLLYPIQFYMNSRHITCDIYLLPDTYDLAPTFGNRQVGTIEVHYRQCPPDYSGSAYYRDCHDVPLPFAALDIADSSDTVTARGFTGADGNVTFRAPLDTYGFPPKILGEPDDHISVFCADTGTPGVALGYPLLLAAQGHVVCDLYLFPADEEVDQSQ